MKRLTAFLLLLIFFLSGCTDTLKEPVTFYYLNRSFQDDMTSAIGSELREAAGHRDDLMYLMALYLMGPANDELQSPLPLGTTIQAAEQNGKHVTLTLSDVTDTMTDARFTMACSCLTLTCLNLTDAADVTIISGDRIITMSADDLLLQDLITADTEEPQ